MICLCGAEIEEGRASLGLPVCLACAKSGVAQPEIKKGYQVYGHKTGDAICIVSQDAFKDMRRLNPYGKNIGKGSGVHVVSKKLP